MDGWCADRGLKRGAVLTLEQIWLLAQLWLGDRLSPDFRRRTMDESHAIFEQVGLTGAFWRLDGREGR